MNKFIPDETLLQFVQMSNQFYAIRDELVAKCLSPVMNQAAEIRDIETLAELRRFAYSTEAFSCINQQCDYLIERIEND